MTPASPSAGDARAATRLDRAGLFSAATVVTIALQVACRLGGATAAILLNLVMARTMQPGEVGHALSAISAGMLGALLASGGIEAAAVRFLPSYLAHDEAGRVRGYLRFGTAQALGLGLIVGGGALAALIVLARRDPTYWPLAIAVPGAALLGLGRVLSSQSLGFGRPLAATFPVQLVRPASLVLAVLALSLVVGAPSAEAVLVCFVLSVAIGVGLQALLTLPLYRSVPKVKADYAPWRAWVGIGLQLGAGAIFLEFGRDLAITVSSLSLSAADVAKFAIAVRIVGFVKFGLTAVNQNFMPALSAAMARSETVAVERLIAISNHLKLWPLLLCFGALVYLGPHLLRLFGPEYVDAAPLLLILMGEPLLMAIFGPASSVLAFSKHYTVFLSTTFAATCLLVAGVVVGGHYAGPTGAAWAVVVAWGFWCALLAAFARRRLGIDLTIFGSIRWALARLRR